MNKEMSHSLTIRSHPSLPPLQYARIMSEGNATIQTVTLTSSKAIVSLSRYEGAEADFDVNQLSPVGLSGRWLVSIERGRFRKWQPLSAILIAEGRSC
jgi:hypothetical protein